MRPGILLYRPTEACGVFGIVAPGEDVARVTYFGLYSLQHRGQESAGITVANGQGLVCHKRMGLVSQVFTEDDLERLSGHAAVGHNRYATSGSSVIYNAQPILLDTDLELDIGHQVLGREQQPWQVEHQDRCLGDEPLA